jgi:isocitrate/isopropylmalate dehydrogenase
VRQIDVGAQKAYRIAMTETLMKTYRIAAIPGDGIGTEVVSAGIEVLHALAKREGKFQFNVDHFDWGGEYYKKHGRMMPENGRSLIRSHDAILFGSAGHSGLRNRGRESSSPWSPSQTRNATPW